jgi:hypothetical protein
LVLIDEIGGGGGMFRRTLLCIFDVLGSGGDEGAIGLV